MNDNIINIAIVQTDISWEDHSKNIILYNSKLSKLDKSTDLVILPEMFSSGFSMNIDRIKQTMDGEVVTWMRNTAIQKNIAILGSVAIEEDNKVYNRAIFTMPDGSLEYYDKRHLFTLADEHKYFEKGNKRVIINYKGWKIMPLICYDLRFPVWSRNNNEYDILIYIANWPNKRRTAWNNLLKARAIENMSYTIGVNRIGNDNNDIYYTGDSTVINPEGVDIVSPIEKNECLREVSLSKNNLSDIRDKYSFLSDRDNFDIVI